MNAKRASAENNGTGAEGSNGHLSPRAWREKRLRVMEKALVEGVRPEELLAAAPAQFGITPRQARRDLQEVLNRLRAEGERILLGQHDPPGLALAVKRRERIYQEAIRHGDRRIALEAEKDRCRLLGIYPGDRAPQDHELDDETLQRTIEAELARLAQRSQTSTSGLSSAKKRAG